MHSKFQAHMITINTMEYTRPAWKREQRQREGDSDCAVRDGGPEPGKRPTDCDPHCRMPFPLWLSSLWHKFQGSESEISL